MASVLLLLGSISNQCNEFARQSPRNIQLDIKRLRKNHVERAGVPSTPAILLVRIRPFSPHSHYCVRRHFQPPQVPVAQAKISCYMFTHV